MTGKNKENEFRDRGSKHCERGDENKVMGYKNTKNNAFGRGIVYSQYNKQKNAAKKNMIN